MNELELAANLKRGDTGADVTRVQEWLSLRGLRLSIDGQYGPATERAVAAFETSLGQANTGVVTPALFGRLVEPMRAALAPIAPAGRTLGQLTVAYAEQHLRQQPREVGGNNRGPWVRLYMGGRQGDEWRWCAGFTCFCLAQAAQALRVEVPFPASFSCNRLGDQARAKGLLLDGDDKGKRERELTPGSFFLVRGGSDEWHHVGIVREVAPESFTTIEGNSNDEGVRDGYEVCSNSRGWATSTGAPRDFIRIA